MFYNYTWDSLNNKKKSVLGIENNTNQPEVEVMYLGGELIATILLIQHSLIVF